MSSHPEVLPLSECFIGILFDCWVSTLTPACPIGKFRLKFSSWSQTRVFCGKKVQKIPAKLPAKLPASRMTLCTQTSCHPSTWALFRQRIPLLCVLNDWRRSWSRFCPVHRLNKSFCLGTVCIASWFSTVLTMCWEPSCAIPGSRVLSWTPWSWVAMLCLEAMLLPVPPIPPRCTVRRRLKGGSTP